jgi:hypothetical protein
MITRKTEERLELVSALAMIVCGSAGLAVLFSGAVGSGIALLAVAAGAGYMADLGRP